MINAKYILDKQDERDGGKTLVMLSIIDDYTGVNTKMQVATFDNKGAAEDYANWMNSRVAKEKLTP